MVLVMAIAVVGVSALGVNNATGKVDAKGGVNLRKSASTSSKIVKALNDNTIITIKGVVFKSKTSTKANKKWYKVKAGKKSGYIRADYVDSISYKPVKAKTTDEVQYRVGAGINMTSKGAFAKDKEVKVLLKATPVKSTAGDSTTWYMVKVGDKKCYACSKYFKEVEEKSEGKTDDKENEKAGEKSDDKKDETSDDINDEDKKNEDQTEDEKPETPEEFKVECEKLVYPSGELKEGEAFSISGKIKCNYRISQINIGIVDANGDWVNKVTKNPNSKTFDISSVDVSVRFGRIIAGSYKYKAVVYSDEASAHKTAFNKSFSVKSCVEKTLQDVTVTARIDEMIAALENKYFTSDKKACTNSVGDTCNVDNVVAKNSIVRDLLEKNKGGKNLNTALLPQHYSADGTSLTRGWSCCGFGNFAGWYVGADRITDDITYRAVKINCEYNYENMSKYARVGDILRSLSHTAMVISVEEDGVLVLDSNWNHDCKVTVHKMTYGFYSTVTINRSTNRAEL